MFMCAHTGMVARIHETGPMKYLGVPIRKYRTRENFPLCGRGEHVFLDTMNV